jgi:NAD(P)-dependent dehydrogenase (short-subunit alcohol dehydrogenase family)
MGSYAARVRREHGRLDILVNNIWGGYEQYDAKLFGLPMWEQPVWHRDRMMNAGVRAHYTSSRALVPLMLDAPHSLVVNISAGDEGRFLGDVQYDAAKAAIDRLAFALSRKLKRHGVVALSVHPGFTRTERVLAAASAESLKLTHSPRFVGRCVVALASDPNVSKRAGGAYKAGQLGLDYGFSDVDGSQPEPFRIPEADE